MLWGPKKNGAAGGGRRNSFFVFVSDRSRSGLAENLGQIRFLKSCAEKSEGEGIMIFAKILLCC